MDLFGEGPKDARNEPHTPLAARMRPRTLDEFVGQDKIVGDGTLLRRAIEEDALTSVIFYGPPGVGKSTLAGVIAGTTKAHFENFSAVTGGVPELRKVIEAAATRRRLYGQKTVLFIDEIHRFNKSQQDALLPHVENGTFVLIGATTENPYFEVNAPLLSRARVFTFQALSDEQIGDLLDRAIADEERGLGKLHVTLEPDARAHLIDRAEGDARTALNALEAAALTARPESRKADARRIVTRGLAEEALQRRALLYDKTGDNHYDTISAFIKSIRGTDPDAGAALSGADADGGRGRALHRAPFGDLGVRGHRQRRPDGLGRRQRRRARGRVRRPAGSAAQPGAGGDLSRVRAQEQRQSISASNARWPMSRRERSSRIPKHLRDSRSAGGRDKSEPGEPYLYPHDYPGGHVAQSYMPEGVQTQPYYEPTDNGAEAKIKARLEELKAREE